MKTTVTIGIPTLNRPLIIERLLKNLLNHDYLPEVILVVDASDDDTTLKVCNEINNSIIKYIKSDRKGLTYQRNLTIDQTQSDYLFFLDDDVLLEKGCVKALKEFLDKDVNMEFAAVGAVISNEFGKSFYKYQRLYYKLGIYEKLEPGTWLYCGEFIQNSFYPKDFDSYKETHFLASGASMFRTKIISNEIRPDSNFRFGGEDKHWTLRLSASYKLSIVGTAKLIHEHYPGGSRKKPIIQGRISQENLYIILNNCDSNLTIKRKLVFILYYGFEINRQIVTKLFLLRWQSLDRYIGKYYGLIRTVFKVLSGK